LHSYALSLLYVLATVRTLASTLSLHDALPICSASIILIDSSNQPLPLGSQVRLLTNEKIPEMLVGFDGEVYLDILNEHNVLEVTDRKSTRLNSSHVSISYAVFCLEKKRHEQVS